MSKPARANAARQNAAMYMGPSSPLRPLMNAQTKLKATVVVLPIPGERRYVASTLEDPKVSVVGATRKDAQDAAMNAYVEKHAKDAPRRAKPRYATPAEEAYYEKIITKRKSERSISGEHWLKKAPARAR